MSMLLEQFEYGFDRDSRRTWRRRALASGEDDAYGYDGLSQVINAARGNLNLNATAIGGVPANDETWDYDPTGNWRGYRVEEDGAVTLDQHPVHDKGNRLMQIEDSAQPVLVDRVGRMRQVPPDASGNWSEPLELIWDAWSRLVEVKQGGSTVGSYAYDGLSRRTTRTAGGMTWHSYYSDAWRPLEERQNSQSTAARQYYWGARHRDDLVRRDRATTSGGSLNETRYVLMDYFSPAAITDGSGNVTERFAFSAFGVRRILAPDFGARSDSECVWDFGFQGQFLDLESGFYDYGFRYYSPYLGRWMAKDPIMEAGGFNLYAFARNGGVNEVDMLGLIIGSYDDEAAAGQAAAQFAYNASIQEGAVFVEGLPFSMYYEFCGFICYNCKTKKYAFMEPVKGYFANVNGAVAPSCDLNLAKQCSAPWENADTYHSHPGSPGRPGGQRPSPGDYYTSKKRGLSGYIGWSATGVTGYTGTGVISENSSTGSGGSVIMSQ